MAVVTEAPGQGDELEVVSRQDKETREHEEMAMVTAKIVLDDSVAALGDRSWGERIGLLSNEERVCRTHIACCVRYNP